MIQRQENCEMNFIKDSAKIPNTNCNFLDILLKPYYELPKDVSWSEPKMSSNKNLIGAKCSSSSPENETVYIWSIDRSQGQKPLFTYTHSSILAYDFCPITSNILIIYFDKEPSYYNCKNGFKICDLPLNENKMIKAICWTFSEKGRYFALGTGNDFLIWDIIKQKLLYCFPDLSPKKFIRDNYLVSINRENFLNIRNFLKGNELLNQCKIKNIKNTEEILCCMLNDTLTYFYYATKNGIFVINIYTGNNEAKIHFDNSEQRYVRVSTDCKHFFSTDYSSLNFWEEKKGCILSIKHEPFSTISYSIKKDLLIIINSNSISAKAITLYGQEPDLFTIYTDANPTKIIDYKYTMNNLSVLCQIDDNNVALYNCITGTIVKKWYFKHKYGYNSICLAPFSSGLTLMSIKLSTSLIQVYDYSRGVPIRDLLDFNCYSTKFDLSGKVIAAGAYKSNECARVWNLDQPEVFVSFKVLNEVEAKQVSVCFVENKKYLICIWENSKLHAFDIKSGLLVQLYHTEESFSFINEIIYSNYSELLIVNGKTNVEKKNSQNYEMDLMLYNCNDNTVKIIKRNTFVEVNYVNNFLLYDYYALKTNEHNLVLNRIKIGGQLESTIIGEINANDFKILPNLKYFYMIYKDDKLKELKYTIHEIDSGGMVAQIKYKHKDKHFSVIDLSMDKDLHFLFRRIMFDEM